MSKNKTVLSINENSILHKNLYFFFLLNILYVGSYLPCGKFFTLLKGNIATFFAFVYIYIYLLFNIEYYFKFFATKKTFNKKTKLKNFFL